MKWAEANKNKKKFDNEIFTTINNFNEELIGLFKDIQRISEEEFELSDYKIKMKEICQNLRKQIKILSELTDVEIEPKIITEFIDKLLLSDVMFAICPGGMFIIYNI